MLENEITEMTLIVPDLLQFLIYSEALNINLHGEFMLMPFKIIFDLSQLFLMEYVCLVINICIFFSYQ
jgi:hypothetical protein